MKYSLTLFLLLKAIREVQSLVCYSCSEGVSNYKCNVPSIICSGTDVCYTQVSRRPLVMKRYTKGCMNINECSVKENLNKVSTCNEMGSICTYCCSSRDLCNAYNGAYVVVSHRVMYTTLITVIHNYLYYKLEVL